MIGRTLSHYRILEALGAGGMGEVYRAHDEHLDRDVAVKVLLKGALVDPTSRDRFRREAHALSRLSHPGVATIFDFDTQDDVDFLVMEFVPGGTLEARLRAGRLEVDEVLRLGADVAAALADAHARGILHRDLKPGNIVLTASGTPKLLDFGLAALLHSPHTHQALTREGETFGSLPYMAPEQIRGEASDARTDVWALGVLLYEMLAGRRPFDQGQPAPLMHEILGGMPPSLRALRPDVPPALERLVMSCLTRSAGLRPGSAGAVGLELRSIREAGRLGSSSGAESGAPQKIRSLAVLPLDNVSRDPAQEYFADGMTEALISDLAGIGALRVISRTSVMKYKGTAKSLPDIAQELSVDAILEGSALLLGNRVRISVRLVEARTDETIWSDRYDDQLEDVLDLQSRVAAAVAKKIAIQLTPREATRLARQRPVNPAAHLELMRGRHEQEATSPQAIELALRHFQRALELDPELAGAWQGIASCHVTRAQRGMAPPAEALAEAESAARRALALDPEGSAAHVILAGLRFREMDMPGAIAEFHRAIEVEPGNSNPYIGLSRACMCSERHAEAEASVFKAISLNPLSMIDHTCVGDVHYYARRFEDSLVYYQKAIELDPRFDGAHTDYARSLEAVGRFDEARAEYLEGLRLAGGVAGPNFGIAHLEASTGNVVEARRILAELTAARSTRVVSAWGIGALHASLGDVDEAFRWLDIAVEEKATGLLFLRVHPRIDALRGDPRYDAMLKRVGLDRV